MRKARRFVASGSSVREQVEYFRVDPDTECPQIRARARALELAESLHVGGDLPRENIGQFVSLVTESKLVESGELCANPPRGVGSQAEFAIEVASLSGERCVPPVRKRRRYTTPLPPTGFWQAVPAVARISHPPRSDAGPPVGYGLL